MTTTSPQDATHECPACAEPIRVRARICRFCGHDLRLPLPPAGGGRRRTRPERLAPPSLRTLQQVKSPALAACLSFLYPGLGQLYCGRVGRGLAILFTPFLFVFLLLLAGVGPGVLVLLYVVLLLFHVGQILDAYQCAAHTNRRLSAAPRAGRRVAGARRRRRRRVRAEGTSPRPDATSGGSGGR